MDAIDLRILDLLQTDGRTAVADVARELGMAASAVHQRIRRLEERRVVQGYCARVDPAAVERGLLAFVHLRTEEPLAEYPVAERLAAMPEVLEIHDVAGEDCYLIKVRVAGTAELHTLLRERIGAVPGVRSTRSVVVLRTLKETPILPLPEPHELG